MQRVTALALGLHCRRQARSLRLALGITARHHKEYVFHLALVEGLLGILAGWHAERLTILTQQLLTVALLLLREVQLTLLLPNKEQRVELLRRQVVDAAIATACERRGHH